MKTVIKFYTTDPVDSEVRYDQILPPDNNPKLTGLWPTGTRKTQTVITEYADGTSVESERFFSEAKGLSEWEKRNLSPAEQQRRLQAIGNAEFAYWKETDPEGYARYYQEAEQAEEMQRSYWEWRRNSRGLRIHGLFLAL